MLEIRYNKATGEITGWWGNRFGNHEIKLKNRPNEAIAELDIGIPDKPLGAWLYDGRELIPNPNYVEPEPIPKPRRNPLAELDALKADIKLIKDKLFKK